MTRRGSCLIEATVRPRGTKGLPRAGVNVPHPQAPKQVPSAYTEAAVKPESAVTSSSTW